MSWKIHFEAVDPPVEAQNGPWEKLTDEDLKVLKKKLGRRDPSATEMIHHPFAQALKDFQKREKNEGSSQKSVA